MYIIMMNGNPATGKTHTARLMAGALSSEMRVNILTSLEFRIREQLFDLEDENQRNHVYEILADAVSEKLKRRDCDLLIIDANFNKRLRREMIYSLVQAEKMLIVRCRAGNPATVKERLLERRKRGHIYENKAASPELYDFIRLGSDPVEQDQRVACGDTGVVEYDTSPPANAEIIGAGIARYNPLALLIRDTLNRTSKNAPIPEFVLIHRLTGGTPFPRTPSCRLRPNGTEPKS